MAGCDTGFVEIDETWTQDKALRKYFSHKNWYTKYILKVQNLKNLNDKAYDSRVEEELNKKSHKSRKHSIMSGTSDVLPNPGRIRKVGGPPERSRRHGQRGETSVEGSIYKSSCEKSSCSPTQNPVLAAAGPARDQDNNRCHEVGSGVKTRCAIPRCYRRGTQNLGQKI